jgi:penicillin-binding protein 2
VKDLYKNRSFVLRAIIVIVGVILLGKLLIIQVLDPSYKDLAQRNVIKKIKMYPTRGLVYDRSNQLMVYNQAVYDIEVFPRQVKNIDTALLCKILDISEETFLKKMAKAKTGLNYYSSNEFIKQVSADRYALFKENSFRFEGFYGSARTIRKYPFNSAGHLLGDIAEVDSALIISSNFYYEPRDYVGKSGVEYTYEEHLRGERGYRYVFIDKFYNEQGSFRNGEEDKMPKQGKSLQLTIDAELQKYGELLLKNKVGSVVAIEPTTGEILALVTSPSIDPNFLSGSDRSLNYTKLQNDPLSPLFNRAIMAQYPPGSTFKPLVAAIAMQEGAISKNFAYGCGGTYSIPGYTLKCSHAHPGARNVMQAIQHSCNPYFWQTFRNTLESSKYDNPRDAYEKWHEYAENFGMNKPLGIDLPNEKGGNAPARAYYNKLYGDRGWRATTIISLGIGQGEILVTPLQLANIFAVFANRGYYITPHVVKSINNVPIQIFTRHESGIDSIHFDAIAEGLRLVVEEGTGRRSKIPGLSFGGKTGTAQNPHGEDHSIFAGFAPVDNPKIVVAAIIENAGGGSRFAAPITSLMIEKYLHDTIADSRKILETQMIEADLIEGILQKRVRP